MRILDSRRLTGATVWLDGPGAMLDVALDDLDRARALAMWNEQAGALLAAVGWSTGPRVARPHAAGASLAFVAPFDALYAATELNEAAWYATVRALGGDVGRIAWSQLPDDAPYADPAPASHAPAHVAAWLRARIAVERQPVLVALAEAALAHDATMLADDQRVSVGLGVRSRSWPAEETVTIASRIPWEAVGDIPVALVTGTNGKSTTIRLLAAIARAAGVVAGSTSTDDVTIGDQVVATGDYSGPNGARTVLRDRRVQLALLELARGGLLRRGLAVPRARVALVTNVADDHLGEFGIFDLAALADVKLVVAKAIGGDGCVVLNADDPLLLERGRRLTTPVLWFTLDPAHPLLESHLAGDGAACLLDGDGLVLARGGAREVVTRLADVPITFDGAARHNVANALAAIGVAASLGLPASAMRAGLQSFAGTASDNPGRGNRWTLGGVQVVVDFAHNPHGLRALAHMMAALPATRRGLVIGQAGDRDDVAIRALAREAWAMRPDRVFLKEMTIYLRGRERGAVSEMMAEELRAAGARADQIERHDSEFDAVRAALAWARPGDRLLLTTHAEREAVIALIEELSTRGWVPGQALDPARA